MKLMVLLDLRDTESLEEFTRQASELTPEKATRLTRYSFRMEVDPIPTNTEMTHNVQKADGVIVTENTFLGFLMALPRIQEHHAIAA